MSAAKVFFDTNVLLYLLSEDVAKADRAEALLAAGGVISVQVLNEFASVASRKLRLSWPEIHEVLDTVRRLCRVEPLLLATHERGLEISEHYGFSIYDALIVASALSAKCEVLLTEDLQDGQRIDDRLLVRNPFGQTC
ncbi:PIN domain-containing protein [Allochromatium vinosum]|uniref:PIN domain-containing protein n=1 Tax=Allochromatium vinosum TaxID=1049 RepID=UPI0019034C27|nr:PIN domain-containing protein [Allochromatium vinosum]MBK1655922.1 VapC toxin family PIN domain ribonuclease [Allochromatium vinosum]